MPGPRRPPYACRDGAAWRGPAPRGLRTRPAAPPESSARKWKKMRLRQRIGLGATTASLALALCAGGVLAQQGPPPGGGPPPGMPPGGGPPSENDMRATQATMLAAFDLLDISPDQMMSQAQAG